MKILPNILIVFLLAVASANAAQLYRWVDGKGNVEWRDTPPPASVPAKNVEQRAINPGAATTTAQPYSVQLAAKNFPVTLWTTDCGDVCNKAREHLARRGVPHTIKNPQADMDAYKAAIGSTEVPVLEVDRNRVKGYLDTAYDDALDYAGYPKTALVPMKPQAIPPVPAPKPAAAAAKPPADGAKPAETAATPAPTTAPATR